MKNLLLSFLLLALFVSCGRDLESVTVKSDPLQPSSPDSISHDTSSSDDDFIHIRIGEFDKIESLDPLFAESNSEYRLMNLIYDGLTALDENGNPEPALAENWEVNGDSSRYTFNLRTDVYFHNVDVFSGGVGKKFSSSDIDFVFKRMASNQVPDYAADMFSNIQQFDAYHTEQTYVKNTNKRVFDSISGIDVQDDSTVVFILKKPSPNFLKKLAHPLASIYASESTEAVNPPIIKAAGTGAFYFVTQEENSHILALNKNYYGKSPDLDRIDIISGLSEGDLFQQFARQEVDALLELSPSTLLMVTDSTGNLSSSYSENDYVISRTPVNSTYNLYYNEESGQALTVNQLISDLDTTDIFENPLLSNFTIEELDTTNIEEDSNNQFTIANTNHPGELYLIKRLSEKAATQGFTTSMSPSYAITEDVTLSTRPFQNTTTFIKWEMPLFILMQNKISDIKINWVPWNIDLSNISVSEEN